VSGEEREGRWTFGGGIVGGRGDGERSVMKGVQTCSGTVVTEERSGDQQTPKKGWSAI
jgi:hypothetical protein